MNEHIKLFIENNIEMIEQDKWDLFFDHAAEMLNTTVISDLVSVCQEADVLSWSKLTMIPDGAFLGTPLSQFTIPEHIRCIRHKAFAYTKLREVHIPPSVIEIQSYAFTGCYSLEKVVIDNAEYINSGAFCGCYNLKYVELPANLRSLEFDAFRDCTSDLEIYFHGTKDQWYELTYKILSDYFTKANIKTVKCLDGIIKE